MTINNFEDLLTFIESNDLSQSQINTICQNCINAFFVHEHPKHEIIAYLKKYWQHLKDKPTCKAIFLDVDPII